MDIRYMENLEKRLNKFEEDIFEGKDINVKEFYKLKKQLIDTKQDNQDLESYDYVFLGNYVGRGRFGLEVVCCLFALKLKF